MRLYKFIKIYYLKFSVMLCRPGSVLCVSSWRMYLQLSNVSVIDRKLLQGMPFIQIILN